MNTRPLGKTGLMVSKLSLGGAAIGQQYGPVSVAEVEETFRYALEAGINFIDTSAYYGEGESERIIGELFSHNQWHDDFMICTKAGRLGKDRFDFSATGMRASCEASLKRLRTDHVDILLAHDIEYAEDQSSIWHETVDTLQRLRQEGKTRYIGVSALPLYCLVHTIQHCEIDVVISYCHYNLCDDSLLHNLLPVAETHGVGVLNASPLAMGLLSPQGPPVWHPASQQIRKTCREVNELLQHRGHKLSDLAMQYCYAEDRIASTITGTAKVEELKQNLDALNSTIDLQLLGEVQTLLAPIHNQTWPSGSVA